MGYNVARGTAAWAGMAQSDSVLVHKDPTDFIVLKAMALKQDVKISPIPVLTPGMQEPINYRYEGMHAVTGNVQTPFYPEQALGLLKAFFGVETPTTLISGAYSHKFTGQDTVLAVPLSFTQYEDLSCMNLLGCFPNSLEIDIDKGNPVELNYGIVGMHGFDQIGMAGKSIAGTAISFSSPIVLVLNTSDEIKLAVDGGTATQVQIAAGSYATATALATAINAAISGTATLLDGYKKPVVACFIDPVTSKVTFYSATKGATSSVVWTAGTNDAGTLLGHGTPVETVGAATNTKPTESTVQPFIATKATISLGNPTLVEVPGIEKAKITIKNGLGLQEVVGYSFGNQPIITGRRAVTGSLDLVFTDPTWLTKYLANTTFTLHVELLTGVAIGSTAYNYQAEIYLHSCKATKIPLPVVSGQGPIKQTIEFQAFYDVTYQDVEIDLQNSLATI